MSKDMKAPALPPNAVLGVAHPSSKPIRARAMLLLLTVIYALNYLDRQIVVILQEPIKSEFKLLDWQVGMVTGGAFGLFYTLMGIPIANWVDRGVNRVRLTACLTAVWSAMTVVCGLSAGFGQFLVARMGVGLAEAGFTPTAHSLLSDIYVQRERPQAVGIFSLGVPIGVMAGLSIGGIVAEATDWRTALFVAGAPGIIAAVVFALVARDPGRGATDERPQGGATPQTFSFIETVRRLSGIPAFLQVILATAAAAFAQSGLGNWLPSFLIRSHDMSLSQVGLAVGVLFGVCGMGGTALGGWLATRLSAGGLQRMTWAPLIGLALSVPLYVVGLLASDIRTTFLWLIPATFIGSLWAAPSVALVQSLAPAAMRARASAITIVIANLLGVTLGPLVVGALSDWFGALRGDAAAGLRDALIVVTLMLLWSVIHWILASRALARAAPHGVAAGRGKRRPVRGIDV